TSVENFISENPHFLHTAFSRWTVEDTISFFETFGNIQGQEKTLGQLFPTSNKAKDIVAVITKRMYETEQDIWLHTLVKAVHKREGGYVVVVDRDGKEEAIETRKVVLASGGLPVAKLGASDFALRTAREFGLEIVPTAPALVPLTITGKDADWYASLAGNSVFARVYNDRVSFEENILFTHWGLSGPAVL